MRLGMATGMGRLAKGGGGGWRQRREGQFQEMRRAEGEKGGVRDVARVAWRGWRRVKMRDRHLVL